MNTISTQARVAVASCGLTRYRLAKLLGVAESTLGRFMAGGEIRTDLLDHIGGLLGMSLVVQLPPEIRELARTAPRRRQRRR